MNLSWKRHQDSTIPKIWHTFQVTKEGSTQEIQIQDATSDRFEEVLDFMAQYFDPKAPIMSAIGCKVHADPTLIATKRAFRQKILEQKVSLIATTANTAKSDSATKVIGVLLLYVLSKNDPPFEVPKTGNYNKIFHMITSKSKEGIDIFTTFNIDKYFEEAGLCVAPAFQKLGIGFQLVSCVSIVGEELDIPGSVIMGSALGSQIIAEKIGFQLLKEVHYEDFKDEKGELLFPNINSPSLKFMFWKFI